MHSLPGEVLSPDSAWASESSRSSSSVDVDRESSRSSEMSDDAGVDNMPNSTANTPILDPSETTAGTPVHPDVQRSNVLKNNMRKLRATPYAKIVETAAASSINEVKCPKKGEGSSKAQAGKTKLAVMKGPKKKKEQKKKN